MKLFIVESPAKSKTISKYLGKDYVVKASVGHIRDLPKSNKTAIDIEGGFIPRYEISKGKEHVIAELKEYVKDATEIILATDPDREGEAIAWHLEEALGLKYPKAKRITYNEITEEAVKEALKHPRKIDDNLKQAQEARRVLDRLFGYDLSGLIWKKVRYGLSAGRVQSPALRIIMEREREIRAFIPEKYFVLEADFKTSKKEILHLICDEEPKTEGDANKILELGKSGNWSIVDIKETEAKRSPRSPFITSSLQQTASTRFGFSPSRTMGIAQKLYEAGHITYMRTDSTNLGEQAQAEIFAYIEKKFGKDNLSPRVFKAKSKNAQEAHEAIRPTHPMKESIAGMEDQKKLYRLIWERTIASQMSDARVLRTKISANIDGGNIPNFSINGSHTLFPGWLAVDTDAEKEEVNLPKVILGEKLIVIDIISTEKATTPPNRYSEAGLIKELESRGIGRPSTYASTIRTIEERGYVTKEGRTLTPTDTGEVVSTFIENNFPTYISDTFTAEMEDELDEIAEGKRGYLKTLKDFYGPFKKEIKLKDKMDKQTTFGDADEKHQCPKCGSKMLIKLSRGGKFMSCVKYPECDGALTIDGHEIKADEPIGIHPETGESIFVKNGRFGPYVQLGIMEKGSKKKPKMGSIPKEKNPTEVTVADALVYLSLPRLLGTHPETGKNITASIGRFGPYIVHDTDFRSVKKDDIYQITHERALEILKEEKKKRGFAKKKK